jgi:HK97 family phage prohead protease
MTSQLAIGTKVEMNEHHTSEAEGKKIASEHIDEIPDYYDRLEVMENPDFWNRLKVKKARRVSCNCPKDEPELQEYKRRLGVKLFNFASPVLHPRQRDVLYGKEDGSMIHKADVFQTDPDDPEQEREIRNLKLRSKLSPTKNDLKEVQEVHKDDDILKSWELDIQEMLKSEREFTGTFHKPVVDNENDIIPATAMDKAMDDFMTLPMLQEVHTERPVGIITKTWRTDDDEYKFVGKIKPTKDCDDVWKKIQNGEYDGLSIGGRRIKYSQDCSIPSSIRTTPCVTHKLKLYSVSVCSKPVNPEATVAAVAKSDDKLVFDLTEMLLKAETTVSNQSTSNDGESDVMTETDGTRGVSKSDDDITKSDIAELTKAIGEFTKAADALVKSFEGFEVGHYHATQRDPPATPGASPVKMHGAESSLKKDEDPDEDPDPDPGKKFMKAEDTVSEVDAIRKAYDAKIADLEAKIEKMGEKVIQKGGNAVIIPQQLADGDPLKKALTNMDILDGVRS